MSPSSVIEVDHVTFGYGRRRVLDDLSLDVGDGLTFLVGENGAGKTTLMRLLLGLERPARGQVRVGGQSVSSRRRGRAQRGVGYLPQEFDVPGHMTVRDFVAYVAWLRFVPREAIGPATARALEDVGLLDRADDRMGELSGGMVRRAGIAQALVHEPRVLLLDEPTVGLDPSRRVEMRALLRSLSERVAVLCSTHLLEDVSLTDGRMLVLADGHLAYDGPSSALSAPGVAAAATDAASPMEAAFMRLVAGQGARS